MKLINMLEDYIELCDMASKVGNFDAYKLYINKYTSLFDGLLHYVYMDDIENLRPMVEQCNFKYLMKIAEKNIQNGCIETVVDIAKKTIDMLGFNNDFDLYIGFDLGNFGGVALPVKQGNPYTYIEFTQDILSESIIKDIIPHEINHMIRSVMIPNLDMYDFTERVITEGLGSYCPIALFSGSGELTVNMIETAIKLPPKRLKSYLDNRSEIEKIIIKEFGTPLTQEKMKKFFSWPEDNTMEYPLSGYFYGMCIIHDLIIKGSKISELTVMPSTVIWNKCKGLNG